MNIIFVDFQVIDTYTFYFLKVLTFYKYDPQICWPPPRSSAKIQFNKIKLLNRSRLKRQHSYISVWIIYMLYVTFQHEQFSPIHCSVSTLLAPLTKISRRRLVKEGSSGLLFCCSRCRMSLPVSWTSCRCGPASRSGSRSNSRSRRRSMTRDDEGWAARRGLAPWQTCLSAHIWS